MKNVTQNKKHWVACQNCNGYGKTERTITKKRQQRYENQLQQFIEKNISITPKEPKQIIDACRECNGSGLVHTTTPVAPNTTLPHVAIIGGGIGGAALAVACQHRGISFSLFERDSSFEARAQGYGLTLQQASSAIAKLGVTTLPDAITSTKHIVHDPTGTVIGEWGVRKWVSEPSPNTTKRKNIHITRQSLRATLLNELHDQNSVHWSHQLTGMSQKSTGTTDISFSVDSTTRTVTADLVVGADGIRSSTRSLLLGKRDASLQSLDCFVMLGICSLENLHIENPLLDSETVFQTVNGHERMYMMPFTNDAIMWQLSFPYPEPASETLRSKGSEEMKKEALQRLAGWHSPITEILEATPTEEITGYPVYDRPPLDPEILKNASNVTLLGDAAHPMSPFKGQGANQALLDALSLANHIYTNCGPKSNWQSHGLRNTLLTDFETEMATRTTPKVTASALAAKLLHTDEVLKKSNAPRGR